MKVSTVVIIGMVACAGLYLADSQDPICTSIKDTAINFGKTVVNTTSYIVSQLKPLIKNITEQAKEAIDNVPEIPDDSSPTEGSVSDPNMVYFEFDGGTILSLPANLVV